MTPAGETILVENFENADPLYRQRVISLWWTRRRSSNPWEVIYMTAHAFTEDARIWEYARRQLESLRNN